MKREKDKKSGKIEPFQITEEMASDALMDKMIREQLIKGADRIEEEILNKKELEGIEAPDDMYDEIVRKLKERGIWQEDEEEEEREEEKEEKEEEAGSENGSTRGKEDGKENEKENKKEHKKEDRSENGAGREKEDIYAMLSDEDREALKLGREMQKKQQKKQGRNGQKRRTVKAAAAILLVICVAGVSVNTEAGKGYLKKMWTFISGDELNITVEKNESNIRSLSEEEEEMNRKVQEDLGIIPIKLLYIPDSMEFEYYKINIEAYDCIAFYKINDVKMSIQMFKNNRIDSRVQKFDGTVINNVIISSENVEVPIWKIESPNQETLYATQFEFGEGYYTISGFVDEQEFTKIIQNINF